MTSAEVPIPVLEVGGTHVTAALVLPSGWTVSAASRTELDAAAPASVLLNAFLAAARSLPVAESAVWGVGMPGPFDYVAGIARYAGVGKFESLFGLDVGSVLRGGIDPAPKRLTFVNDASAFAVGEWLIGEAKGAQRCAAITLGTGIGSAFLCDGRVIDEGPDVPPHAEVHLLRHAGRPLEDWVSRRAIMKRYAIAGGQPVHLDVREIAARARCGEPLARGVLTESFTVLGTVLGPWLARFGAEILVVGGAISGSWDVVAEPLKVGLALGGATDVALRRTADGERSALVGIAYLAETVERQHDPT